MLGRKCARLKTRLDQFSRGFETSLNLRRDRAEGSVAVVFSPRLGVPPTEVPATSLGGDHYRVSGLYAPMVGAWRVATILALLGASETA
jgi:hypothetical protein